MYSPSRREFLCSATAIAAGLAYAFTTGWLANVLTLLVLLSAQLIPAVAFSHSVVWPWVPGTLAVILATASAAAWRHLLVRRELVQAAHLASGGGLNVLAAHRSGSSLSHAIRPRRRRSG